MNKTAFLALIFIIVSVSADIPKLLYRQRKLQYSTECNMHGILYQGKCFCETQYSGAKCETKKSAEGYSNTADVCDDLTSRLDNLFNISPSFYSYDDAEFPRLTGDSIGSGTASYGEKGNTWIRMHDVASPFRIIGDKVEPRDVGQGALGDCYMLAAIASLANVRNGEIIRDAFMTQVDNDKHVYVTRWLIDGKPRVVAVDDWIPGSGASPSFSKPTGYLDKDFWSVILEKAWGKIHGNYMTTQGGWHTEVWSALTQAPISQVGHSSYTVATLLALIRDKLVKQYPIGCATVSNTKSDLVQGHAYSVLGVHDIKLTDSTNSPIQTLIQCFNPWNSEQWDANPWNDNNTTNWTPFRRAQIDLESRNDGIFFLTPEDYYSQFGQTNWAEVRQGYVITFQDIALKAALSTYETKNITITLTNNLAQDVFVTIETPNSRLLKGCSSPFTLAQMYVQYYVGGVLKTINTKASASAYTVTIPAAANGKYFLIVKVLRTKDYHKFFTVTIYSAKGVASFDAIANNDIAQTLVNCPNSCSANGRCNTFNGNCTCYFGWQGTDCSTPLVKSCPNNCNNGGQCDTVTGTCSCYKGFDDAKNCLPCADQTADCKYYQSDVCTAYASYCLTACKKFCGAKGLPGFGTCTL